MPYIEAAGARLHVEEHGDGYWPGRSRAPPLIAYQAAFGTNLILQVAAWLWFTWPRVREAIGGLSNRCWAYDSDADSPADTPLHPALLRHLATTIRLLGAVTCGE